MNNQPWNTKAVFLEADEIFTLKVEHDMMKIHNASELTPQRLHLREVVEKILRQCETQRFYGE